MPAGVFDKIKQQTFLGASIINWNINLGYNSSPTQFNVNLINDKSNQEIPTGLPAPVPPMIPRTFDGSPEGEGYHYRRSLAVETAPVILRAGIYPDQDWNGLDHPPHYEAGFGVGALPRFDFVNQMMIDAKGEPLYLYGDYFCPPPVGAPVWFSYYLFDSTDARAPFPVPLQVASARPPRLGAVNWDVGSFNGIFTDYTIKTSTGGEAISVTGNNNPA